MERTGPFALPAGSYMFTSNNSKKKLCKTFNKYIIEKNELGFQSHKQQIAKNLAKFMLKSKHICISKDGKSIVIKNQPKTALALLDYLKTVVCPVAPNKVPNPKYILFQRLRHLIFC
jgi:hypothetical protein